MMYFKLALKNVKKSFKDYAIYFFTLIVGVSIFYMFNSLDSQTIMLELSDTKHSMLNTMNEILSYISVFVAFILAFLIVYASRFLMKRRKKEFGIYMLLGMKKTKISMIILTETLFVGIISLGVGLLVGIGLSQLMSVFVANMFEANMTKFAFTFSKSALLKTVLYFIIIYLGVMIFNVISVNKCKLIDLINANKKTEKIKVKNIFLRVIIFIIGVILLGYAYYNVTANKGANIDSSSKLLMMVILGCISTFLIFWSLSGMLLRIVMSMNKTYYKGINSFVVKQLSSQINTNVFSTTIICLMLFVTICIFSSAMSLKDSMNSKIEKLAPIDVSISKVLDMKEEDYKGSLGKDENAIKKMVEESKYSIQDIMKQENIDINKTFKDIVSFNIYETDQVTTEALLGKTKQKALEENPDLEMFLDQPETIIRLSDYNRLAELIGNEKHTLNNNEYIIVANQEYMIEQHNKALEANTKLLINGKEYSPKYTTVQKGRIELDDSNIAKLVILPDNAINENMRTNNKFYANYNANSKEEKLEIEKKVSDLGSKYDNFYIFTKQYLADESVGFGAMVVFLGLYLGIVFLISSGVILALKELSESTDNIERYNILRKIGVDEMTINKALFKQIGIFFLLPLILAIIHSIFGIQVANMMIETFGKGNQLVSILLTAGFIILIYGGYFLISYYSSKRIIRGK